MIALNTAAKTCPQHCRTVVADSDPAVESIVLNVVEALA